MTASGTADDYCDLYHPVRLTDSERGTLRSATIEDIDGNNAVYLEVCLG